MLKSVEHDSGVLVVKGGMQFYDRFVFDKIAVKNSLP
jgi:2-hydroxy-3-keto-5-methylthiopentenyl-1-phosphate phosphatase